MLHDNKDLPMVKFVESTPLFTLNNLRLRYTMSSRSINSLLYRLRQQGRVEAIAPGVYRGRLSAIPLDRYQVPDKLRADAVIGFHSALEYHGVANQVFRTIYYTSSGPRRDVVHEGITYHRVAPPRRLLQTNQTHIQTQTDRNGTRVASRERAFIDCLLLLSYSGGVGELDDSLPLFPSFNFEQAVDYLSILGRPWLYARLGYLLTRHAERLFFDARWQKTFQARMPKGVAYLEDKRRGCRWVREWNIMVPPNLMSPGSDQHS